MYGKDHSKGLFLGFNEGRRGGGGEEDKQLNCTMAGNLADIIWLYDKTCGCD